MYVIFHFSLLFFTDLVILVVVGQFSVMTRTTHTFELNAGIHAKVRVLQPALASSTCYLYVLGVYFSGNTASQNNYSLNIELDESLTDSLRFS